MQDERRNGIRTNLESSIIISRLDQTDSEEVHINIIDVSKSGIGFTSTAVLEIGNIYESFLYIWTKERIHAFLEIRRVKEIDDVFEYGAFFIGMSEMDTARIANYSLIAQTTKEMEENE